MALFKKKVCSFCNKQLGALESTIAASNLADGNVICDKCRISSCSKFAPYSWITSRTKEQLLEHINETQIMRNKIATEFDVTDVITDYRNPSRILASIDRNRRLWIASEYENELLSIDYISRINVDLDYERDEVKIIPRAPYTPPRDDMPSPIRDANMRSMTIEVYIENHPYAVEKPIKLKICTQSPPLLQSYATYFDEVYTYGAKCLDLFDSLMK